MTFIDKRKWRVALLGSAAFSLFAMSLPSSQAFAQDADVADDEDVEQVIVTGSRIKRAGYDTLQPAVTIDSDFMDDRGFTNVAQGLNEIPAFGIPGSSDLGGQSSQSVGQNFVNAFGLGSQRTLTLVNGRRMVGQNTPGIGSGASAGLQVDLNIIPTALVDRIETVFVGGAPAYGSDAVAATVNIILKDDYEGFEVDAQYGVSDRNDAKNYRIRGIWGGNFADGRGNAVVTAEYVRQDALRGTDRQQVLDNWGFCPNPDSVDGEDGIPDNLLCKSASTVWQVPNTSLPLLEGGLAFPGGGNVVKDADGNPLVFDPSGNLITWDAANFGDTHHIFFSNGDNNCGSNPILTCLPETNTLVSPMERWIVSGNAQYQINDNIKAFVETLVARTDASDTNNQPPWSISVFGPGMQGNLAMNIADNPFLKPEVVDTLIANGIYDPADPEPQFLYMNRSNSDLVGGRENNRLQNVMRIVTGLEGDFMLGGRNFDWDAYYSFGVTDGLTAQSQPNGIRYGMALDAITNADGDIVCRVTEEYDGAPQDSSQFPSATPSDVTGCLPFNPFGVNQNSEEVLDYLIQQQFRSTLIRQQVWEASVSGDIFDLPAGPLGFAAGVTHRREHASFSVDQASEIGIDPTTAAVGVSGGFNTQEVYGELLAPLISDGDTGFGMKVPFINSLEFEGAIRYVDNTRAGGDTTWTAGARMRLDLPLIGTDMELRGNFTRSIRAPSVQELFLPKADIFTFANDPCDPRFINGGPVPDIRSANCTAEYNSTNPADPAALADFVSIIVNASQPATTGGNPNLINEIADSWTVGGVYRPSQIPGLTLAIDWTEIKLTDAITSITGTQLMNACYDSSSFPSTPACSLFGRDASTFQVLNPELGFLNTAVRQFKGLVANADYSFEVGSVPGLSKVPGEMQISANYFYNDTHYFIGSDNDRDVFDREKGNERHRAQFNFRYNLDKVSALWQVRYIGGGLRSNEDTLERNEFPKYPSSTYHNVSIMYQITDNFEARFVVNNLFDKIDSGILVANASGNSNLLRDVMGRRFNFGLTARF